EGFNEAIGPEDRPGAKLGERCGLRSRADVQPDVSRLRQRVSARRRAEARSLQVRGLPRDDRRADRRTRAVAGRARRGAERRAGAALSNACTFLKKRDETDAVREVALMELARDPSTGWAHQARGDVIATDKIDRVVAECTKADTVDSPGVRKLARIRKAHQ